MLEMSLLELCVIGGLLLFPLLVGFLVFKKYNIIQGIITFIFFNYIYYFLFSSIQGSISIFSEKQNELLISTTKIFYDLINSFILLIPNLKNEIVSIEEYMLLTIVVGVFLFGQVISMTFTKNKVVKN